MRKVFLVALTIIIFVLGAFMLLGNKSSNFNLKQPFQSENQKQSTPTPTQIKPVSSVIINVTANGFVPEKITVKPGTNVAWTNNSGTTVSVNSDVYPTNLLWPFLNLGTFNNGSGVSTFFAKPGTYTYHNQINPSQKGTVIVK